MLSNIYDPDIQGMLILTFLVMLPPGLALLALLDLVKVRLIGSKRRRWLMWSALIGNVVLLLCAADAWLVEPGQLTVTRISSTSPKIGARSGSIKVIQISDLHFVQQTVLTTRLLDTILDEKPDLIFLTGDMYQPTGFDEKQFSACLSKLTSIAPVYAIMGFDDDRVIRSASNDRITILDDSETVIGVRGTGIRVMGMQSSEQMARLKPDSHHLVFILTHSPDSFLNHMKPDVTPHADWAFAGHTHGGQVRIPFWGAAFTGCYSRKKYEYGQHKLGECSLFVSRGIGMEPHAPQIRFLCPPEIVVLTISSRR